MELLDIKEKIEGKTFKDLTDICTHAISQNSIEHSKMMIDVITERDSISKDDVIIREMLTIVMTIVSKVFIDKLLT